MFGLWVDHRFPPDGFSLEPQQEDPSASIAGAGALAQGLVGSLMPRSLMRRQGEAYQRPKQCPTGDSPDSDGDRPCIKMSNGCVSALRARPGTHWRACQGHPGAICGGRGRNLFNVATKTLIVRVECR